MAAVTFFIGFLFFLTAYRFLEKGRFLLTALFGILGVGLMLFNVLNLQKSDNLTAEERAEIVRRLKDVEVEDIIVFHGWIHIVSQFHPKSGEIQLQSAFGPPGRFSIEWHLPQRQPVVIKKEDPRYSRFCELFVKQFATPLPLKEKELAEELETPPATQTEPPPDDISNPSPEPEEPNAPRAPFFLIINY